MSKKVVALLLCALMILPVLASCSAGTAEDDVGSYITMYLTDESYDFDPANAYYNTDTFNVTGLLFDTLFTLDTKGKKVEKSLVKSYKVYENIDPVMPDRSEYMMEIKLNTAYWSNGDLINAEDVLYAWQRLLKPQNSFEAAALLFDIKNARLVKEGGEAEIGIDDIGVAAVGSDTIEITFEGQIDYDQFLLNLTSLATAPISDTYASKGADWAKKPSTMVTSGAFKIGKISYVEDETKDKVAGNDPDGASPAKVINYFYLERNSYYYRDTKRDAVTASVKPYRILVDCSKTDEEIMTAYENDEIFFVGSIPLSYRADLANTAKVTDALSTFVLSLNENAVINGVKLFALPEVRQALSMAIDREEIKNEVVFANAATGLIPNGVLNTGIKSGSFRSNANGVSDYLKTDAAAAKQLIASAGINAADYTFAISVPSYAEVDVLIADKVAKAWSSLGFHVSVNEVYPIQNDDADKETGAATHDICDDLFLENYQNGNYEVSGFDYVAYSADAYSMLANFATAFSGMAIDMKSGNYDLETNRTGFENLEYNILMEAVYYVPYYASLDKLGASSYVVTNAATKPYEEAATTSVRKFNAAVITLNAQINVAKEASAAQAKVLNAAFSAISDSAATIVVKLDFLAELTGNQTYATTAKTLRGQLLAADKLTDKDAKIAAYEAILSTAEALTVNATGADSRTLKELIAEIYTANNVKPSANKSDWTKQKAVLLHAAEDLFLQEMPMIPVLFNQNAILAKSEVSGIKSNYYLPATFRYAKLKNYGYYVPIFNEFPELHWDYYDEEPEVTTAVTTAAQ